MACRTLATPVLAAGSAELLSLTGLSAFYEIGPSTGGEYFAVHRHLDIEHSADLRALCSDSSGEAAAMAVSLWNLLTSVDAAPRPV